MCVDCKPVYVYMCVACVLIHVHIYMSVGVCVSACVWVRVKVDVQRLPCSFSILFIEVESGFRQNLKLADRASLASPLATRIPWSPLSEHWN